MKTLDEIWQDFDKKGGILTLESIEDLKWHIENDRSLYEPIAAARDMMIETGEREHLEQEIVPTIAKHLDHEDEYIRAIAVGTVIGICKDASYGEKALVLARFDPDECVRAIATSSLGWVMNKVDQNLAHKMAVHLYTIMTSQNKEKYGNSDKDAARDSVRIAMEVYYPEWETVDFQEVWGKFLKKYNLQEKEFAKMGRGW
jgi:hypothetical protein